MNCELSLNKINMGRVRKATQEKSVPKFLRKLFFILENNQHSEYICWSNDGIAIVVKKPTEFAEEVLPRYFKHSNFASFVRQLNMYNFKKKNIQDDHAYSHEMFQRGKIELLKFIQRKSPEVNQPVVSKVEVMGSQQEEDQLDVDTLIQENLNSKRVQKSLITQFQFVERKVKTIKTEISSLYEERAQLEAKEDFLKKVIQNLSKQFGSQSVEFAIQQVVQETSFDEIPQEKTFQAPNTYSRFNTPVESPKKFDVLGFDEEKRYTDIFSTQDVLSNEVSDFQNSPYSSDEADYKVDANLHWQSAERKRYNSDQFLNVNKSDFSRFALLDAAFESDFGMFHGSEF